MQPPPVSADEQSLLPVGTTVGSYRIERKLRSGGMGTTYLAHRIGAAGFARHVAIKAVHPHLASDPLFLRMFVDEALLAARIDHPNVVRVEELVHFEDTYLLVMEYVSGCSLAQLMRVLVQHGQRLSPQLAFAIAIQVADGLHAAHETLGDDGQPLGVVHRDVTPENILLSASGHVKLTDFGIAKARGRSRHTEPGTLQGKVRYMAPEQAAGRAADRRIDIYSLGVVLWEMLTATRYFKADSDMALLDMVRHPSPRPPGEIVATDALVDRVVTGALQPSPDDRPADAATLRLQLADAMPRALVVGPAQLSELVGVTFPDAGSEAGQSPAHRQPTPPTQAPAPEGGTLDSLAAQSLTVPLYGHGSAAAEAPADVPVETTGGAAEKGERPASPRSPHVLRAILAAAVLAAGALLVTTWYASEGAEAERGAPADSEGQGAAADVRGHSVPEEQDEGGSSGDDAPAPQGDDAADLPAPSGSAQAQGGPEATNAEPEARRGRPSATKREEPTQSAGRTRRRSRPRRSRGEGDPAPGNRKEQGRDPLDVPFVDDPGL